MKEIISAIIANRHKYTAMVQFMAQTNTIAAHSIVATDIRLSNYKRICDAISRDIYIGDDKYINKNFEHLGDKLREAQEAWEPRVKYKFVNANDSSDVIIVELPYDYISSNYFLIADIRTTGTGRNKSIVEMYAELAAQTFIHKQVVEDTSLYEKDIIAHDMFTKLVEGNIARDMAETKDKLDRLEESVVLVQELAKNGEPRKSVYNYKRGSNDDVDITEILRDSINDFKELAKKPAISRKQKA